MTATLQQIIAARLEIADRVEEAFAVLARMPDNTKARLGMQTMEWPLVVRQMWEDAPAGTRVRRPPPLAAQISRMEEVLGWMVTLAKANRKWAMAVYLMSGRRWEVNRVALVMGCHRNSVPAWHRNGLDYIAVSRDCIGSGETYPHKVA